MKVVCKENTKCHFAKKCTHSKIHDHSQDCAYKNNRCCDNCICDTEYVFKFERKTKLEKLNESRL